MNKTIVVTSGNKYIDIDAYAGCIAYTLLLNSLGYNAKAVTSATLNNSILSIIKSLNYKFDDYTVQSNDKFIVLDVSNPSMIDNIVNQSNITEVIDHHVGYENYWNEKKEVKSKIEFIGSICTIIFEMYEEYKKTKLLNKELCQLLIAGILDNTLNLMANITTARDKRAYKKLLKIGKLDLNWSSEYFEYCEKEMLLDIEGTLTNDIKAEFTSELLPKVFGQLVVLDKDKVLEKIDIIKKVFYMHNKEWVLNLISLKDGKSYLIADNKNTQSKLEKLFDKKFNEEILILDRFMLRKEIIKKARDYQNNR